jgi:hypothetical protein
MRARGDAAFLIGGRYLDGEVCSYNGLGKATCPSSKCGTVFCPMADRWARATGNYSFRFFSPEQIDRILREGVKRGRTGSHCAIERILKHEPASAELAANFGCIYL